MLRVDLCPGVFSAGSVQTVTSAGELDADGNRRNREA